MANPKFTAALRQSDLNFAGCYNIHVALWPIDGTKQLQERAMLPVSVREVTMNVKYKTVQEVLRKAGIVMSKKGEVHRINFFSGLENTAYYTPTLQDALDKGLAMAGGAGRMKPSAFAKSAETGISTSARIG
ncbi:hypothetical protein RQ479_13595 [Mesorhizobium sp. ISC25]|uniref:hypothetical protein n=1 Tax=Mesorhizobium sp. ISC25 TaxID=3077335 RepID=UPI0035D71B8B